MEPRLRFAPSPSGYLHIGGVRTALFNWLWARKTGGKFVLRVEDTDQERSSIESVRAILDAMTWLGLDWDEGPEVGGEFGSYFQSERKALYRASVEKLISEGKAYRCFCTKEELDAQREALKARDPKAAFVYPGTCRNRADQPGVRHVVRFKSPTDGVTEFNDRVFGLISTPNASQQDFVLVRTDGYPLYNLAATVDDHEMQMTFVARGRDHIGNTPQQVLLYRAFGWEPPQFAHLPMMLAPNGEKLSKRHASVSVQEYKDKGYTPAAVLNYLVRFGWSFGDKEIFSRQELIDSFDWDRVNKSDGKFDAKKFADVAYEHLKQPALTTLDEYAAWTKPFLAARGLEQVDDALLRRAIPTIRERAHTLVEAADALDYYFREPPQLDEKAVSKYLTPESKPRLAALASVLESQPKWAPEPLEATFRTWVEAQGWQAKDVAQPLRVAVTGRTASPPLFDVLHVLGRERSLARLKRAGS